MHLPDARRPGGRTRPHRAAANTGLSSTAAGAGHAGETRDARNVFGALQGLLSVGACGRAGASETCEPLPLGRAAVLAVADGRGRLRDRPCGASWAGGGVW